MFVFLAFNTRICFRESIKLHILRVLVKIKVLFVRSIDDYSSNERKTKQKKSHGKTGIVKNRTKMLFLYLTRARTRANVFLPMSFLSRRLSPTDRHRADTWDADFLGEISCSGQRVFPFVLRTTLDPSGGICSIIIEILDALSEFIMKTCRNRMRFEQTIPLPSPPPPPKK